MRPALITSSAALAVLLVAPRAPAFCRAHTCNRNVEEQYCKIDDRNCVVSGNALSWSSNCLRIGINEAGSIRHDISFEQLKDVTEAAFQTWANADCTGGSPSFRFEVVGPIPCDESEYNSDAGNINLVVFRDDTWPYVGGIDALGTTFVRFNADTGEIWDADIEINGTVGNIGVDGTEDIDLQSLLTHEAGHVLGLDHSDLVGSTMVAGYEANDTSLRTLEFDDVDGVCAIFPPGAASSGSCEPRGGFSNQCGGFIEPEAVPPDDDDDGGCGVAAVRAASWSASIAGALGLLVLAAQRRRRTRENAVAG